MSNFFKPIDTSTKSISASSISANTVLFTTANSDSLMIQMQTGSTAAFIRISASTATAVVTDMAIITGNVYYVPVVAADGHIGAICGAAGTATLLVTNGNMYEGKG